MRKVDRGVLKRGCVEKVKERCRLSWLSNSALAYEPKCGGGVQVISQWIQLCTWSPNKLWRYNSICNLWLRRTASRTKSLVSHLGAPSSWSPQLHMPKFHSVVFLYREQTLTGPSLDCPFKNMGWQELKRGKLCCSKQWPIFLSCLPRCGINRAQKLYFFFCQSGKSCKISFHVIPGLSLINFRPKNVTAVPRV